ncbi:MAG: hypothetical protein Rsou_0282 [Candidatus Ruthia sp. Asou_11_S2]|nr:hypothetical protein [Candidatus Ruthia sp. Asou_11_S2]
MKNKTKKILLLAIGLTSTMSFASLAEEVQSPISGNITIANDYIWRGLAQHVDSASNHEKEVTISGGLDYDFNNGFALEVWGSNVSFKDASIEMDLYGSYAMSYKQVDYEVGYISYQYPNATAANFEEVYVGASYKGFGLTQYKGIDSASDNLELSYNLELSGIDTTLVYGDYKDSNKYHSITLAKSMGELDYTIAWNKSKPTEGDSESHIVFSIGKSF